MQRALLTGVVLIPYKSLSIRTLPTLTVSLCSNTSVDSQVSRFSAPSASNYDAATSRYESTTTPRARLKTSVHSLPVLRETPIQIL